METVGRFLSAEFLTELMEINTLLLVAVLAVFIIIAYKIFSTFMKALIIGVINNGLNLMGVDPYIQDVAKGLIIFLAVAADVIRKRHE